ncbi:hairy/enhancer-of-split related with YRPW motif-like protein [Lingula anatina]|uniref:Hairy/enhancer-of-split related with YRPW motif-like protein n=1 Tax=Lingula anatina TaxID=7574 RepID=A0A1S3JQE9_LINAN|nr:hairy/enhancer-of-split related with YRPW motif-like protein [Lingula anatina]|eukprot:XP_013412582.1 hairy/enhancer-of-split related with YRPW motif-like protein [Lingula anatina]
MDSRKSNKPLMEKRRRARINECLNQLKYLVLQAMNRDGSAYSKLEKADILEMTVKFLRGLQRQSLIMSAAFEPNVVEKFKTGFSECTTEVQRYMTSVESVDPDLQLRLVNYLANCVNGMSVATTTMRQHTFSLFPVAHAHRISAPFPYPVAPHPPGGFHIPGAVPMFRTPPSHTITRTDMESTHNEHPQENQAPSSLFKESVAPSGDQFHLSKNKLGDGDDSVQSVFSSCLPSSSKSQSNDHLTNTASEQHLNNDYSSVLQTEKRNLKCRHERIYNSVNESKGLQVTSSETQMSSASGIAVHGGTPTCDQSQKMPVFMTSDEAATKFGANFDKSERHHTASGSAIKLSEVSIKVERFEEDEYEEAVQTAQAHIDIESILHQLDDHVTPGKWPRVCK